MLVASLLESKFYDDDSTQRSVLHLVHFLCVDNDAHIHLIIRQTSTAHNPFPMHTCAFTLDASLLQQNHGPPSPKASDP